MKFGVREVCDVVFKAKADIMIGCKSFKRGQPVLYIDTAKMSTMEGAATTVYATGGQGNARLIAWEGEKTLTFTVEDALLSPMGFAILSGAGLFKAKNEEETKVHAHTTAVAQVVASSPEGNEKIDLAAVLDKGEAIDSTAPIFIAITDDDGSMTGDFVDGFALGEDPQTLVKETRGDIGKTVFVDFYITKKANAVSELQIDAKSFAGYFYVEASTLFRRQTDGVDMPVEITLPNVKVQSNFTFTMASTGDPSTFTFTMDAFPGYTLFNKTKKVLCVMQIIEDIAAEDDCSGSVMLHDDTEVFEGDAVDPAE